MLGPWRRPALAGDHTRERGQDLAPAAAFHWKTGLGVNNNAMAAPPPPPVPTPALSTTVTGSSPAQQSPPEEGDGRSIPPCPDSG